MSSKKAVKKAQPSKLPASKLARKNSPGVLKDAVNVERPVKKTVKPKTTNIILKDISAVQTVLACYAVHNTKSTKVLKMKDGKDTISQTLIGDIDGEDTDIPVTQLLYEKSKRAYYFLDARKMQNKFWCIMVDVTLSGPLPSSIQKPCWWCRHKFNFRPIGCPLKYNSNKCTGIEKERYEEKLKNTNLPASTNDFFETEGIFCSFPCCKAFILDQHGSAKYKESITLLSLLFSILHGIQSVFSVSGNPEIDFPAAPSWKLLREYGGHLTIEEYRATFGKLEYFVTVNVRRPYMYSSSQYIAEKKIKLFKDARD